VSDKDEIIAKASTLFKRAPEKVTESKALFICPYHAGGKERTASLNLTIKGKYSGGYYCFACAKSGSVFKAGDDSNTFFYHKNDTLLQEDANVLIEEYNKLDKWPEQAWRTINYRTMKRLKARIRYDLYPRAVLPVFQNRNLNGLINCSLFKSKPSYIYSPGPWIKKSLFPYDYIKKIIKTKGCDTLFLVEGPRDAAKLLEYNIPALANLGGTSVFSLYKVDLIHQLDIEKIVFAFDPDEVGKELTNLYRPHFKGYKLGNLNLSNGAQKEDPASMSELKLESLKATFGY
jgi:DNA primase